VACIHGYAARDGFGITRIRNHAVELIPNTKKDSFMNNLCPFSFFKKAPDFTKKRFMGFIALMVSSR
jgi:hypothetical protein